MTRPDPPLDALLAGLVGDVDQQQALCVELLTAMTDARLDAVCRRVAFDAEYGKATAAAVAHFATLGLLVATRAWQGDGMTACGEGEGT